MCYNLQKIYRRLDFPSHGRTMVKQNESRCPRLKPKTSNFSQQFAGLPVRWKIFDNLLLQNAPLTYSLWFYSTKLVLRNVMMSQNILFICVSVKFLSPTALCLQHLDIHTYFIFIMLKFGFSEKHTKLEKIFHLKFELANSVNKHAQQRQVLST